jgi:urate oxidase/2-oxo-4-hydroxy-4-carboxy-5-ureidoimidazoline decarboxylase
VSAFRRTEIDVERFASGWKRSYYGKGDVNVYRLHRDGRGPAGQSPVFGANVLMLVYGDAFWPTYTTGDNTGLVATDSMKNFIQRETLNYPAADLEGYCRFLADKFLNTYPQVEGVQVSAEEIPYEGLGGGMSFTPSGPERATARVELAPGRVVEARSGLRGFKLLRLGGSAFHGFVRDQYTTLPDLMNRPLHMWLDLEWSYTDTSAPFNEGRMVSRIRDLVRGVFESFESGSIQQLIHRIGVKMLEDNASIAQVDLEANNRTWDTIAERGAELGVYTEARPPYGCLGLSLKR